MLTKEEMAKVVADHTNYCNEHFSKIDGYKAKRSNLKGPWLGMKQPADNVITEWETGMPVDLLKFVGAQAVEIPQGFVSFTSRQVTEK